ncbi:MAG: hypothetical protein ACRC44_00015 [Bifidobacterium asteroides]
MKRGAGGRRDVAWREIGRAAITEFNQHGRAERPRCGAKAKHTGMPCQNLGLENGRCHLHGGRTPRGDDWHRLQLPTKFGGSIEKLNRKLRDAARHERRRAARVAAMSPEQRAAYDAWHAAHRPGSRTQRDQARRDREAARSMLAPRVERPPSQDEAALAAEIARLKARLAEIDAVLEQSSTDTAGAARGDPKE